MLALTFGCATALYWTLGTLLDGAMGRVAAPWSDGQIYTCGTVLQAAAFPGFLLSGWLVDRLGWFEATVNGSLLAAAAALAAFSWLLAVDPAEGQPTGGLYAGIVAATFACGFSFALFQPAGLGLGRIVALYHHSPTSYARAVKRIGASIIL